MTLASSLVLDNYENASCQRKLDLATDFLGLIYSKYLTYIRLKGTVHYHFFVFCFLCIKISQSLPQSDLLESYEVTISSVHRAV